jgi:hypothetical protein
MIHKGTIEWVQIHGQKLSNMDLFDNKYISPKVTAALPKGFVVRPLHTNDYDKGFVN